MKAKRLSLIPGVREKIAKIRFQILRKTNGIVGHPDKQHVSLVEYSREHLEVYTSIRERVDFLVNYLANTVRMEKAQRLLVLGLRYETGIHWTRL